MSFPWTTPVGMVGEERLERSSAASKTAVLPLDDSPAKWSGQQESNPPPGVGSPVPRPLGHARMMERPARIELAPPGWEPSRLPLTYGRKNGGCGEIRTLNQRLKRPLRSSVAPRTRRLGAPGRSRTCTCPLKRRVLTTEPRRHDWRAGRRASARERALARRDGDPLSKLSLLFGCERTHRVLVRQDSWGRWDSNPVVLDGDGFTGRLGILTVNVPCFWSGQRDSNPRPRPGEARSFPWTMAAHTWSLRSALNRQPPVYETGAAAH